MFSFAWECVLSLNSVSVAAVSNRALCSAAGVSTEEVPPEFLPHAATLHWSCLLDSLTAANVSATLMELAK